MSRQLCGQPSVCVLNQAHQGFSLHSRRGDEQLSWPPRYKKRQALHRTGANRPLCTKRNSCVNSAAQPSKLCQSPSISVSCLSSLNTGELAEVRSRIMQSGAQQRFLCNPLQTVLDAEMCTRAVLLTCS